VPSFHSSPGPRPLPHRRAGRRDAFDLRIAPVAKHLAGATVRMLA